MPRRRVARVVIGGALLSAAAVAAPITTAGCGGAPQADERSCRDRAPLSVCATAATVKGIDVSVYQQVVDWPQVKAAGGVFAFARVSDGVNTPDTRFIANWQGMKAAGIVRGAYQFFRPSQDPIAQADLLLAKLDEAGPLADGDLPIVMDMEATDNQSTAVVQARMQAWLDKVEKATGRAPIIYTAPFMSTAIGNGFTKYVLWVANYGVTCPTMPAAWKQWTFWQTSGSGTFGGVRGPVDLDEFNGTLADLLAFASPKPQSADGGTDAATPDAAHPVSDGGTLEVPDAGAVIPSPPDPASAGPSDCL
jgi:lysozyme